MRKMLNKKGFSLVELMIVVVIMGILIAVAIPLYGAITDNANNKTCATNIKTIKQNAANYFASHDQKAVNRKQDLADMFDDKHIPKCPVSEAEYTIAVDPTTGAATVFCKANASSDDAAAKKSFHDKDKIGSVATSGDLTAANVLS